jgi:hypothetical protein
MKKVIKPSKQPTKKQNMRNVRSQQSVRSKQSQRSVRSKQTAKLKIAIGKIAAQLVKNHPKLVKGGGSSDITELIFSKNLMKGGEIGEDLRNEIVQFLKKFAPKVNELKHTLLINVIQKFIDSEVGSKDAVTDSSVLIVNLNKEFNKGVYEYNAENYKGNFEERKDIYDDFIILDIVKKFYILSRIKDADIPNEISSVKFNQLSAEIIDALDNYGHDKPNKVEVKDKIRTLLEVYKSAGTEAAKYGTVVVKDETEIKETLYNKLLNDVIAAGKNNDIVEKINKSDDFVFNNESDPKIILKEGKGELDETKTAALKKLNELYTELEEKNKKIQADIKSLDEKSDLDKLQNLEKLIEEFNELYREKYSHYLDLDITKRAIAPIEDRDIEIGDNFPEVAAFGVVPEDEKEEKKKNEKDVGGNPTKYKSTGQVVNIMYKKRKYKRTIFVKEKRKTKYCKINNEYILLSKLNVL